MKWKGSLLLLPSPLLFWYSGSSSLLKLGHSINCQKALFNKILDVPLTKMCCNFMTDMYFTIGSKHATCSVEESKHRDFMHPLSSWIYRICTFTLVPNAGDRRPTSNSRSWHLEELSCIILCRMHKNRNTWKELDNVITCIRTLMSHSLSSSIYRMHKTLVFGFFNIASHMLQANGEIHVSHKTTTLFSQWNIQNLVEQCLLTID